MKIRALLEIAIALLVLASTSLGAQEHPARRVANIVSVAVEEYGKGVDERGRLISADEYQEATDFLVDAKQVTDRLTGARAVAARAILDSIIAAASAKRPPSYLGELEKRFADALGAEGALELPRNTLDLRQGQQIYAERCASCHGARGMGDGKAAATLNPKPPAIGDVKTMHDRSPAIMYRIASVGIAGTPMTGFASVLTPEQRWNVIAYVTSLHSRSERVLEGEGIYVQQCISCHGANGASDGVLVRSLSKLPPEIGALAWQAERSDSQLAVAIRGGVPGSPMPPARELSDSEVSSVVAYLRTLPTRDHNAMASTDSTRGASAAASNSITLLEQALSAARSGRASEAGDRAFDAYLAFEPIESPARARDPGVVSSMEKLFADFKAAVRANDLRGAERARDAIEATMPTVVDLTRPTGSGSEAFWQSFLIILREGFEAILVIGAIVAFLRKTGNQARLRSIWWGIGLALAASAVTAIALKTILGAIPASREIIEGLTLIVAVAVLFSVSYWLISRVEAAKWQAFIREKVNDALEHGGGKALAFVAFLAVYREGAETALFYQALFSEGAHVALPISLGILVGFAALAVIFTLFYRYGVRIPLRPFFSVTSVLLYYMAFVFMGKGIRELQEGNAMPITLIPGFPTVEALGLYPTWQTLLAQIFLLSLFVFALAKTFWPKRSVTLPTVLPESKPALELAKELSALRQENERLRERLEALEHAVTHEVEGQGARG
jgi:high-affinity iron transporter